MIYRTISYSSDNKEFCYAFINSDKVEVDVQKWAHNFAICLEYEAQKLADVNLC